MDINTDTHNERTALTNQTDLTNPKDNWLLPPMVGEISNRGRGTSSFELNHSYDIVILCEPKFKITPLICMITSETKFEQEHKFTLEPMGPTRIILSVPHTGIFQLRWYQMRGFHEPMRIEIFRHEIVVADEPNRLIFVSCDLLEADTAPEDSMWTRMQREITPNNQTYLIHVGDQAYMDKVFNDCVELSRTQGQNDVTATNILMAFGRRYCETWMPHHLISAAVSNYNLWDDHDLKNDMTLTQDDISSDEKYVRDIAVHAYIKYQESLHLNKHEILSRYSWYKRINQILILAVERTSCVISVSQILKSIDDLTSTAPINRLILCFASAPIPPPRGPYGSLYRHMTGDKGTSETSKFWSAYDLSDLYRGLFVWLSKDAKREVLVVGGDLHFGTYGIVRHNGRQISVIISSPITNQPNTERWLAAKGMAGTHYISNDNTNPITFETIASRARRCYAVVNLDRLPMHISMHYSTHKLPQSNIKYFKTLLSFK